jgi:hypothetical protein
VFNEIENSVCSKFCNSDLQAPLYPGSRGFQMNEFWKL